MNDTQFDKFFNDTFRDHAVPVPANLWDKVVEDQFDQFIGGKLKDAEAPVPDGMWDKINDKQFDNFVAGSLGNAEAPVPNGLWDRISDVQFDAFAAEKLKDHEAPVPDGLWEKIMPAEEDDKGGFWWFRYPAAAVLLLGLLVAGGYLYYHTKNNTNATVSAGSIVPSDALNGEKVNTNKENTNSSVLTNPANPAGANAVRGNNHTIPPANGEEKAAGISNNTISKRLNSPVTMVSADEASVKGIRKKKGIDLLRPGNDRTDLTQTAYDPFGSNPKEAAGMDKTNAMETYPDHLRLGSFTIPSELNGYSLTQNMSDKQLSTANHTAQFHNIIICPSDNKNRNTDWYLEAYTSSDIPFRSLSNVSASQQYLLKKDSAESMQVSYSTGLRLVKPITDNILVKAGLQYAQINQKYVYRTENEVKTTTVVTVRTIIRAPGDTVVVQDTSVLQTVGFRTNTVHNRFRSFDLPVTLGYQFGNDDLKIGINAGVVINLNSWYQGVILDSSLATVTLNKTGNSVYKTNIGLGLIGGISVIKRLSDDMHLFFEPYFRYNLSNMTSDQASYRQKFSVGGLSIGLRFNLNRK